VTDLYSILYDSLTSKPRELVTDWREFRVQRLPGMERVMLARSGFTAMTKPQATRFISAPEWPMVWRHLVPEYLAHVHQEAGAQRSLNHWRDLRWLDVPAPLYYAGGHYQGDELAYVDITAAHYSIYSRVGSYNPSVAMRDDRIVVARGKVPLDGVDLFADDRDSRNALAGFARAQRHAEYRRGHYEVVDGPMRYTSPGLWAVIGLTLCSVALEAIELGAVYVSTDGFVFEDDCQVATFRERLAEWGFGCKVKGRGGVVDGLGSYRLGDVVGHSSPTGHPQRHIEAVNPAQRESLRRFLTR
jgi:hypothetical protein